VIPVRGGARVGNLRAAWLGLAAFAAVLMAGCSGAGVSGERARGGSVLTTTSDNVNAVLLAKSWFAVLHPREDVSGAGVQTKDTTPETHYEFYDDGSYRAWGVLADGTTFDYLTMADGSGHGEQTRLDGARMTITFGAMVGAYPDPISQTIDQVLWDGSRFVYRFGWDFAAEGAPETRDGTATLVDGRAMHFLLVRKQLIEDHLTLDLPDGSRLEVRVPLTSALGAMYWPVFSAGARGTYRGASGQTLDFVMTGQGERWDRWELTGEDGTTGVFTLDETLGGSGEVRREGELVGALRWTSADPSLKGILELLASGNSEITPSAATLDFLIDQRISNIATLGPNPPF
jgi:hypothetical protein